MQLKYYSPNSSNVEDTKYESIDLLSSRNAVLLIFISNLVGYNYVLLASPRWPLMKM